MTFNCQKWLERKFFKTKEVNLLLKYLNIHISLDHVVVILIWLIENFKILFTFCIYFLNQVSRYFSYMWTLGRTLSFLMTFMIFYDFELSKMPHKIVCPV